MKIDYHLENVCKGTMLDLKYPLSPYMPMLTGKLLERFLEKLDLSEKQSRETGRYIIIK